MMPTNTERHPSLVAHGISRAFVSGKVRTQVLKEISVALHPGELTLVMGPSGSGKSTLLAILGGLLMPDTGSVTALEVELTALDESALDRFRLHHVGFIFQGFNLFPALTALEQVALVLQYLDIDSATAKRKAHAALEEVQLSPYATLRPLELSGGQKQRVAIARSLVKNPKIIFADEPTSALDSASGDVVVALLHRAARSHGATVVIVTHDGRLLRHADRVLYLEDGVIVRDERTCGATARKECSNVQS